MVLDVLEEGEHMLRGRYDAAGGTSREKGHNLEEKEKGGVR
jgi:hypothetical protein